MLALASVAVCLLFWAAAVPAQAATSYLYQGESANGTLGPAPTDVAIDDATGFVLVVDSSNDRVVVFESSQPGAAVVTTFGEGELSDPYGIAVDPGGDVYVADAGNDRIVRYTSDGAAPPTYTLDGTYTSPAKGTGAEEIGNFASTLAIDPADGDLLVADKGNLRVERFDSSGAFVESFNGSDSDAGAFTSLLDVATAPDSSIYVIANGTVDPEFGSVENSVVDKFAADGTFVEALAPGELGNARALGYDPRLDNVLVTNGGAYFEGRNLFLRAVHNGQLIGSYEMFTAEECSLGVGVAVPSDPTAPLSILTARDVPLGCGVASLLSAKGVAVDVTLSPPSAVTGSGAHLSGTVDPHGESGSAHFEYRRAGAANWTSNPDLSVSGEGPQPVEEDLTGLLANESYEVRLSANVAGVGETSAPQQFDTESVAPTATTEEATGIAGGMATLNGSVNPNGTLSTFYFEYGETQAYGSRIPFSPAPAGIGQAALKFSRQITGLTPGTTYHFRIVAANSAGVSQGDDLTFVAGGLAPAGRAYEQVTPVDTQGNNVDPLFGVAALEGVTGISYTVKPLGSKDVESAPYHSRLLSLRGTDDWEQPLGTDPPMHVAGTRIQKLTLAVSNDGTHAFVVSNSKLTPEAVEGEETANLYIRDLRSGTYEFVATTSGAHAFGEFSNIGAAAEGFVAAADDFNWIIFSSKYPLLSGVTGTAFYRWSDSGLEVMSKLDDGSIPNAARLQDILRPKRITSTDGSRLLFGTQGGTVLNPTYGPVYMRVGNETIPVSVSEVDGEEKPGQAVATDTTGRYAFFLSSAGLVPGAPETEGALYRYDLQTGDLEYLFETKNGESERQAYGNVFAVSPDGTSVLFGERNGQFGTNLKLWHEGQIHTLKEVEREYETPFNVRTPQFSSDSHYLAYSDAPQAFTGGVSQASVSGDIYRIDATTGEEICLSCIDGKPTHAAFIPSGEKIINNRLPRSIDDEGNVFFTSSAALDPKDSNNELDVYEYHAGQASLITPGNGPFRAYLVDISADGRDVYFVTTQALVARDTNQERDIYDARAGGGLPIQSQLPPPSCAGEGCQGLAASAPGAPSVGSEAAAPSPNKKKHTRCKKPRVKVKGKCVKRKGKKAHHRARHAHSQAGGAR
ncbi:MAG TPA: hypothetical protein VFJ61_07985 [Solirubrobacterales bacterium]|nr:hypothetical protein [Solirubrobacterales bacterium]